MKRIIRHKIVIGCAFWHFFVTGAGQIRKQNNELEIVLIVY